MEESSTNNSQTNSKVENAANLKKVESVLLGDPEFGWNVTYSENDENSETMEEFIERKIYLNLWEKVNNRTVKIIDCAAEKVI